MERDRSTRARSTRTVGSTRPLPLDRDWPRLIRDPLATTAFAFLLAGCSVESAGEDANIPSSESSAGHDAPNGSNARTRPAKDAKAPPKPFDAMKLVPA